MDFGSAMFVERFAVLIIEGPAGSVGSARQDRTEPPGPLVERKVSHKSNAYVQFNTKHVPTVLGARSLFLFFFFFVVKGCRKQKE